MFAAEDELAGITFRTLAADTVKTYLVSLLSIGADVPGEYWERENFLRDLPGKWQLSFAGWSGTQPVAYAILSRKSEAQIHLHHLIVGKNWRGRGLGRRMVDEIFHRCRTAGAEKLTLKVHARNERAKSFYVRSGFREERSEGEYLLLVREFEQTLQHARVVAIHQPNYLPWLGYFHKLAKVDTFVFLDDVQFSKGSYTNRVQILRGGHSVWLTQPIRHRFGQTIADVEFSQSDWVPRHLDMLRGAYTRAPAFRAVWPVLADMLGQVAGLKLAAANRRLIELIAARLGLETGFHGASELGIGAEEADARLAQMVARLAPGGTYLSGRGGAKYQDPAVFAAAGISLAYTDFSHPDYPQPCAGFTPGLSIVDALFAMGWEGTARLVAGEAA